MRERTWAARAAMACVGTACAGVACGGGAAPMVGQAQAPASESRAPQTGHAPVGDGLLSAPESLKAAGSPAAYEDDARRRGLGTAWGETRASRVHDVAFAREDPSHPFSLSAIRYDDAGGVRALAAFQAERSAPDGDISESGGWVTVSIRDAHGDPLAAFTRGGRSYVVGREGERYSIAFTNQTGHRFEAVTTVDGLDVVSGKQGSFSRRGYLIGPYATVEIDGFRQSRDAVAAFRFSRVSESYAAQTSGARDVGVIGVALFAERGDSFAVRDSGGDEVNRRDLAQPFRGADRGFARPPH